MDFIFEWIENLLWIIYISTTIFVEDSILCITKFTHDIIKVDLHILKNKQKTKEKIKNQKKRRKKEQTEKNRRKKRREKKTEEKRE